jgi:hypothetical protein
MLAWSTYTMALGDLTDERNSTTDRPDLRASARTWLNESLRIFADAEDVSGYTLVMDALALTAFREGDLERAARLSGAVESLERASGTGLNLWNRELLGWMPREMLGDPALSEAWAAGEQLSGAEAVAYALSG